MWSALVGGFLLGVALLIGAMTLVLLGLSITFGSGGFGGDTTVSAAARVSESRGQFGGVVALALAVAAIPLYVRLRSRPDLRVMVLSGLVLAEMAGLALLISGTG